MECIYCQLLGGGGSIGVGHVWGGHYVYEWGRGGGYTEGVNQLHNKGLVISDS